MYKYFVIMNLPDLNNLNLILFYSSCIPQHERKIHRRIKSFDNRSRTTSVQYFLDKCIRAIDAEKKTKKNGFYHYNVNRLRKFKALSSSKKAINNKSFRSSEYNEVGLLSNIRSRRVYFDLSTLTRVKVNHQYKVEFA